MGTSDELTKRSGVPRPTGRCEHREHAALKGSTPVGPGHTVAAPSTASPITGERVMSLLSSQWILSLLDPKNAVELLP